MAEITDFIGKVGSGVKRVGSEFLTGLGEGRSSRSALFDALIVTPQERDEAREADLRRRKVIFANQELDRRQEQTAAAEGLTAERTRVSGEQLARGQSAQFLSDSRQKVKADFIKVIADKVGAEPTDKDIELLEKTQAFRNVTELGAAASLGFAAQQNPAMQAEFERFDLTVCAAVSGFSLRK